MKSIISSILNKKFIINLLFSLLFFSFIAGNLLINLNILLILIFGFIFYRSSIFKINYSILDKLIISLFLYILLNGIFNNYLNIVNDLYWAGLDYSVLIKSIYYLRFLLLYFLVNYLVREEILNFKVFFISAFISVAFVSLDIIYQFFFGYDIFGFEAVPRRLSGPFGDELIAGSYIFRFGIFSFFLYPLFLKIENKRLANFFMLSLFTIMFLSMILAGNRTSLVLFILTLFFITIFEKNLRKYFLVFFGIVFLLSLSIYKFHPTFKFHIGSYHTKIVSFFNILSEDNILTEEELEAEYRYENKNNMFYTLEYKGNFYKMNNTYIKEFKTGYLTWKENKFFGGGIKSFIMHCARANIPNCVNHPHNYYLEILSELGLFGFFLISLIFSIIIIKSFIKKYFNNSNNSQKYYIITPFIFLFLMEIFPIKNTGSFFSTFNATYIFLILSILISLSKKQYLIENKT